MSSVTKHNFLQKYIITEKSIFVLYLLLCTFCTARAFLLGTNKLGDVEYTFYNNYVIFKNSFLHLASGVDLYILHNNEQWDLYKYSPAFAIFMGFFAYLPDWLGLFLWNFINIFAVYYGIKKLPLKSSTAYILALLYVLQELYVATINAQSNALIVGLLLMAFIQWDKKNTFWACVLILSATFIKPFAIVFFLLWFFYGSEWKAIVYSVAIFCFFILLPLPITGVDGLVLVYKSWLNMLTNDHAISHGVSVMGMLYKIFGWSSIKNYVLFASIPLLLLPLLRLKAYNSTLFKAYYISFMLIWMVIFNHRAESPTFIITVCGVALWFFADKKNIFESVLLFFILVFTQFATSDIIPPFLRDNYIKPYELKALPCVVVWFYIFFKLMFAEFKNHAVAYTQD